MNDAISRKSILEWLEIEIDLSSGNDPVLKADKWAFQQIKKEIESGRFDKAQEAAEKFMTEVLNDGVLNNSNPADSIAR